MATFACLRPSLLRLPPQLRTSILQSTRSRSFSATTSRSISLADIAVAGPNAVLDGFHSVGLSWAVAIPATALFVRGVLGYQFAALPARKRTRAHNILMPLVIAKGRLESQKREQLDRKEGSTVGGTAKSMQMKLRNIWIPMSTIHQLGKKFGAPLFSPRGWINFAVLIAFTEAIRMKCSSRHGLLNAVVYPFQWLAHRIAPDTFNAPAGAATNDAPLGRQQYSTQLEEVSSAATEGACGKQGANLETNAELDKFEMSIPDGNALAQACQLQHNTGTSAEHLNPYFDPSMHSEGLPWIQDLTLPDHTLALPIALGATLTIPALLDARSNPGTVHGAVQSQRPGLHLTRLQRFRISIGFIFSFVAVNLPSAVLLYFATSMAVAALQRVWLDFRYPIYKPIMPCTRPVRMKVTRKWDDI